MAHAVIGGGKATRRHLWAGLVLVSLAGSGCGDLLKNDELPPDISDPAITRTPAGALAVYNATVAQFRAAYAGYQTPTALGAGRSMKASFVVNSGLLSDELQNASVGSTFNIALEDTRSLPEGGVETSSGIHYPETFGQLQRTRAQAGQAAALLARYLDDQPVLASHVYALQGYTEVYLAELFCSGIPLSTLHFDGDYMLQPGSSTEAVFAHAITLFDSAFALAGDDVAFQNLARLGKARALLALEQYAAAAAEVAPVPSSYSYLASYTATAGTARSVNFAAVTGGAGPWPVTIANVEGGTGLDYLTSADPRITVTARGTGDGGATIWHPTKLGTTTFTTNGANSVVVANGVEARLIEAEAALQANPDDGVWLATLNALRTTCVDAATCPTPAPAGSGGVAGLPLLADPGAALSDPIAAKDARVDLLFRERAFWLFLTGHRQGDLRRLIRQYGRTQEQVYPTGPYPAFQFYGSDVTAPVPTAEQVSNPRFTGCISRAA